MVNKRRVKGFVLGNMLAMVISAIIFVVLSEINTLYFTPTYDSLFIISFTIFCYIYIVVVCTLFLFEE